MACISVGYCTSGAGAVQSVLVPMVPLTRVAETEINPWAGALAIVVGLLVALLVYWWTEWFRTHQHWALQTLGWAVFAVVLLFASSHVVRGLAEILAAATAGW